MEKSVANVAGTVRYFEKGQLSRRNGPVVVGYRGYLKWIYGYPALSSGPTEEIICTIAFFHSGKIHYTLQGGETTQEEVQSFMFNAPSGRGPVNTYSCGERVTMVYADGYTSCARASYGPSVVSPMGYFPGIRVDPSTERRVLPGIQP